jgi:hypothetical protein
MVGFSRATLARRRGLLGFSLLAVVLAIGVGTVLWQAVGVSSVSRVSGHIQQLKPVAAAIRLGFIGLLGASWPWLVERAYRYGRIGEGNRAHLLAQRWRIVVWLMVIELMLGQTLLGRFLTAMTGSQA